MFCGFMFSVEKQRGQHFFFLLGEDGGRGGGRVENSRHSSGTKENKNRKTSSYTKTQNTKHGCCIDEQQDEPDVYLVLVTERRQINLRPWQVNASSTL